MRKLSLDVDHIVVHSFDTDGNAGTAFGSGDPACTLAYCSFADPCDDVAKAPTPNGITCDVE